MKNLIICLIVFCSIVEISAQSHAIKGRAIATPVAFAYSVGIGYEYVYKEKVSVQILYNKTGFNWDGNDGGRGHKHALIPEVRYYFNRNGDLNKSAFVGCFFELANKFDFPSGDRYFELNPDGTRPRYYVKSKENFRSPGLLIGKSVSIANTLFFEGYIGMKYNYIINSIFYSDNTVEINESKPNQSRGVRLGFNLGYRF